MLDLNKTACKLVILTTLVFISACGVSIDTWVEEKDTPQITEDKNLSYWESKGYREGPCGWTLTKKITKLPPTDNPDHVKGTEVVFEIDQKGRTLASWSAPANSYPVALRKDQLIVDGGLTIDHRGHLDQEDVQIQPLHFIQCPDLIHQSDDSSFLKCAKYQDLISQKTRILAFQTPCT